MLLLLGINLAFLLKSSTVVSGKSTIGSGSSIGKDSKIKDSVIGNNVTIGIFRFLFFRS